MAAPLSNEELLQRIENLQPAIAIRAIFEEIRRIVTSRLDHPENYELKTRGSPYEYNYEVRLIERRKTERSPLTEKLFGEKYNSRILLKGTCCGGYDIYVKVNDGQLVHDCEDMASKLAVKPKIHIDFQD